MRKMLVAVALLGGAVTPLAAQGGGGMGRGFAPPPNHWMTMDSVGQALGLTAAEKTAIQPQYDSINAILMRAAAIRDSMRASMQSGGGDPRAAMAAARPMMQSLQDQEDGLLKEIHGKISAAAAAKLNAAPPPRAMRQRPGGMGGGPGR